MTQRQSNHLWNNINGTIEDTTQLAAFVVQQGGVVTNAVNESRGIDDRNPLFAFWETVKKAILLIAHR
jgi:hypothetical protein